LYHARSIHHSRYCVLQSRSRDFCSQPLHSWREIRKPAVNGRPRATKGHEWPCRVLRLVRTGAQPQCTNNCDVWMRSLTISSKSVRLAQHPQVMTESEAIEIAQRAAKCRRWRIQFRPITAHLVDAQSPYASMPRGPEYIGKWIILAGSSYAGPVNILVDDQTGRVTWINGPPPLWLQRILTVLSWITLILMLPLDAITAVGNAWYKFRLPRCPRCRSKLRTPIAQQCPKCRYAWHDLSNKPTP
jgi:hypothetical protein